MDSTFLQSGRLATWGLISVVDYFYGEFASEASGPSASDSSGKFDNAFILTESVSGSSEIKIKTSGFSANYRSNAWYVLQASEGRISSNKNDANTFLMYVDSEQKIFVIDGGSRDSLVISGVTESNVKDAIRIYNGVGAGLANGKGINLIGGISSIMGSDTHRTYIEGAQSLIYDVYTKGIFADLLTIRNPYSVAVGGKNSILASMDGGMLFGSKGSYSSFVIGGGSVIAYGALGMGNLAILNDYAKEHVRSKNSLMVIDEIVVEKTLWSMRHEESGDLVNGVFEKMYAGEEYNTIATYKVNREYSRTGKNDNTIPNTAVEVSGTLFNMSGYIVGSGSNTVTLRARGSYVTVINQESDGSSQSKFSLLGDWQSVNTGYGQNWVEIYGDNTYARTEYGQNVVLINSPSTSLQTSYTSHVSVTRGANATIISKQSNRNITVDVGAGRATVVQGQWQLLVQHIQGLFQRQSRRCAREVRGIVYLPQWGQEGLARQCGHFLLCGRYLFRLQGLVC